MSLDALIEAVGQAQASAKASPLRQFEVTQVSPLLVRDLTTPNATPLTPLTVYLPSTVGERVYCLRLGNRVLVLGRAGGGSAPTGTIHSYAGTSAPAGYLLCDGALVLRASYPALFAVIGTTYGSTLSTNFRVPNLLGRVPVGLEPTQVEFDALGETGGAKTHTLAVSELPPHAHRPGPSGVATGAPTDTSDVPYRAGTGSGLDAGFRTSSDLFASQSHNSAVVTAGQAHNNLQPYIVLNYIIKD